MNVKLVALDAAMQAAFFAYLDDHLRDNGKDGTALFQPIARAAAGLPEAQRAAFTQGMATSPGEAGWRRVWVALDADGAIAGHIDLRARPEPAATHRALLGMGVHRAHRRQGLGARLIAAALGWARTDTALAWIDLEVLSANIAARQLYQREGFVVVGDYRDMLRIDGATLGMTHMSARVRVDSEGLPNQR